MLATTTWPILGYREAGIPFTDPDETGTTFVENAMIKVQAFPHLPDTIYLADDSGLSVDALDGAPGVFSARYGGPGLSDDDRCYRLLLALKNEANRGAAFHCVIAIRFPDQNHSIQYAKGEIRGEIIRELRGGKWLRI